MKNILYPKYFFIPLSLLFFYSISVVVAQPSPSIEWQRCLGGTSSDVGEQVVSTRDGGYIIVGTSYSKDGDIRNASPNEYNGWVVKLDQIGNTQWSRSIEGDHSNFLHSVIETSIGDFVLAGGTSSLYVDTTKTHGNSDALVVKLNKEGDILWQKIYGGSAGDGIFSIIENKFEGGGYVFAGFTSSLDGDVVGRHSVIAGTEDSTDAWIVKISTDGNIEWQKCLGGSKSESAYSIVQTQDGGWAFAGETYSKDGDVSCHTGINSNAWLVKLSLSGNILWQKCFNNLSHTRYSAQSIVKTNDGGLTIIGSGGDSNVRGYHKPISLFEPFDVYIVHLNSLGTVLWERCYGSSYDDWGVSIITTSERGYLIIGKTSSFDGDVSGFHKAGIGNASNFPDVWVAKLSIEGDIEWQNCFGGSSADVGVSIVQTNDGKILFIADIQSNDGDISNLHDNGLFGGPGDIWAVKLGINADVPVSSNFDFTGLIRDKFLKIYPNPSSSSVHLEMLPWFTAKGVEIYNLLGTKLSCETTIAENGANVSVKSLPNGTYIARVAYTTEKVNGTFTLPLIVYH